MSRITMQIIILLILTCSMVLASNPLEYSEEFDDFPVVSDVNSDSNFTVMSYSLPNNPRSELIYGNHLYLGCGPILKIYELQVDGQITPTGQIQTRYIIFDIEHDGDYLYLANGPHGVSIFEGNDFESPEEISNIRPIYSTLKICPYGDSLLFLTSGSYFGIMNITDAYNPYVERIIDDWSIIIPCRDYEDLHVYNQYLIADITIRNPSPRKYLGVYDLSQDSLPVLVDTVYYNGTINRVGLKVFDNRIYQQNDISIQIFELNNGYLELQSEIDITEGREQQGSYGLLETNLSGNTILLTGIYSYYTSGDSVYSTIHAYNINDLSNPVLIDSTIRYTSTKFLDILQYGSFTYGILDHRQYSGLEYGLLVIEWDDNYNGEVVDHYTEYHYCTDVVVGNDIAYATTQDDRNFLLDITNKSNPLILNEVTTLPINHTQMEIHDDTLYVLTGSTFRIYTIYDPSSPELVGMVEFPSGNGGLNFKFCMGYALIGVAHGLPEGPGGLLSIDINDPENPEVVYEGRNITDGPKPIKVNYPLCFLPSASSDWLVAIYDIEDPADPDRVVDIDDIVFNPMSVSAWQNYLYVFGAFEQIYDVSNPFYYELISDESNAFGDDTYLFNDMIYLTETLPYSIQVWDISQSPLERYIIAQHSCHIWGDIAVKDEYVYVPARELGLAILRLDAPTDIAEDDVKLPVDVGILSAYPNPFNSTVKFSINTPISDNGEFNIYDIAGRLVKTIDFSLSETIQWDGTNFSGSPVGSGVYFGRYSDNVATYSTKIILLR